MKSRRYSEEQIVRILGEIGSGRSVAETARQYGVAVAPSVWRGNHGGSVMDGLLKSAPPPSIFLWVRTNRTLI